MAALPLTDWDIFYLYSETTKQNLKKLDRKQEHNVIYQVFVFLADRKTKMAARPLIGWDIFDFSSGNGWTEFDEIWQEARTQRHLPSFCFYGRLEKEDDRSSNWHFRLHLWNRYAEFDETSQEART